MSDKTKETVLRKRNYTLPLMLAAVILMVHLCICLLYTSQHHASTFQNKADLSNHIELYRYLLGKYGEEVLL